MIKKALFIFIAVVTVVISSVLLDAPADIPLQAWQDFKAEYGEHLEADWNSFTETPEWIRGVIIPAKHMSNLGLSAPIDGSSAQRLSLAFIDSYISLFRISSANLRARGIREYNSRRLGKLYVIEYDQTFNGVPVEKSHIGFTIDIQGHILSMGVVAHSNINISTTPACVN